MTHSSNQSSAASTNSTAAVELHELKKSYQSFMNRQGVYALRGINLKVQQGDFFGLLGPNGSGKTTLISILCGLVSATSGNVLMHGTKASTYMRQHPRYFGLVPQELALYPTLTIHENLSYFAKLYGYHGSALQQRIINCLQATGLENCGKLLVGRFSGGMKRRANLAITLLHEPSLLILDEPTVNVDPQSRNMIFDTLNKLHQTGTTIIYTTHYMEEAEKLCTRAAIMDHGQVLCCDSPQRLIEQTEGANNLGEVFLHTTGYELRD